MTLCSISQVLSSKHVPRLVAKCIWVASSSQQHQDAVSHFSHFLTSKCVNCKKKTFSSTQTLRCHLVKETSRPPAAHVGPQGWPCWMACGTGSVGEGRKGTDSACPQSPHNSAEEDQQQRHQLRAARTQSIPGAKRPGKGQGDPLRRPGGGRLQREGS